jgi:hypothetical protein
MARVWRGRDRTLVSIIFVRCLLPERERERGREGERGRERERERERERRRQTLSLSLSLSHTHTQPAAMKSRALVQGRGIRVYSLGLVRFS